MRRARRVVLCLLVALGALLLGEVALRLLGRAPAEAFALRPGQPAAYGPDADLGWTLLPGEHVHGPDDPLAPGVRETVLPDGSRSCGPVPPGASGTLLVLGGSFTEGLLLDDAETWPARLQRALPDLRVVNCGVAGWGTYQCLLRLERELAARDDVRLVVYGFIQHHEARNAGIPGWLARISLRYDSAPLPWASLDERGRVVRHPPDRWTTLPLRGASAFVAALESLWMRATRAGRDEDPRALTDALLLELDRTARSGGARLLVALLQADDEARAHYRAFLAEHGVACADVVLPMTGDRAGRDGIHPGAALTAEWAASLLPAIDALR